MLKITLTRSLIGFAANQHRIARALGLGKTGSSVCQPDTPAIRGMIHKIRHLLTVETVVDTVAAKPGAVAAVIEGES
jgi:large subunit ribosomal protein L30